MRANKRVKLWLMLMLAAVLLVPAGGSGWGGSPVHAAGTNLLTNPGFETGTTAGWTSMGTATLAASSAEANGGAYSGLVSGRQADWNGISQSLLANTVPGLTYDVAARVRLQNSASDTVKLTMRMIDSSGTSYTTIAQSTVTNGGWIELRGTFVYQPSGAATDLLLYVEGPQPSVNFYVDDLEVAERTATDWKAEANARIEQLRKRDAAVNVVDKNGSPVAGATVHAEQTRSLFGFGSAINNTVLSNPTYANFFKDHFEWAVFENESKWYSNESSQGNVNYSVADQMLAWAQANGIPVRGHTVHWEVEDAQPSWVKSLTGTALRTALDNRITSVVNHFKGKFKHWDVNNEMLHGSFFKDRLGASIWPYMYERTKQLDPDAKLFVNDYNVIEYAEDNNYKLQIQQLLAQGAPIDGIGAQGHFGATVDPYAVKQRLDNLATFNLPIWITEYDSVQPNENIRADNLEALYRLAYSHPAVEGVMMWGFWAGSHWRGADAAIVNQNWTLNAAGQRYLALMDEWKTDVTGTTGATGKFAFRGFQGSYKLTVTVPGASPVVQTLELAPGASVQQVTVTVDAGGPVGPEAPAAPGGLVAAAGNAQVALSWNASTGATGYNVKRSTASGGPYVTVAAGTVGTSYTDTGVTNGTTYYYTVSAINAVGESANSAAASATPNVPVASDLVVQYKANNPNPNDNQITAQFNIKNRGSAPVAMTGLKLRYYFTKEGAGAALNFWSDYAQIGGSNVSGTFVTMAAPKPGADTYLEISFGAGAGSIPANGQSGEIHARFAKSDWTNFNESDDYSYDGTKAAFADWSKVTLYLNGQRAWGNEP